MRPETAKMQRTDSNGRCLGSRIQHRGCARGLDDRAMVLIRLCNEMLPRSIKADVYRPQIILASCLSASRIMSKSGQARWESPPRSGSDGTCGE